METATKEPQPRKKPSQSRRKSEIVHFRVTPELNARVDEAIEFDRAASVPEFFDRAVHCYLQKIGFEKSLPRR